MKYKTSNRRIPLQGRGLKKIALIAVMVFCTVLLFAGTLKIDLNSPVSPFERLNPITAADSNSWESYLISSLIFSPVIPSAINPGEDIAARANSLEMSMIEKLYTWEPGAQKYFLYYDFTSKKTVAALEVKKTSRFKIILKKDIFFYNKSSTTQSAAIYGQADAIDVIFSLKAAQTSLASMYIDEYKPITRENYNYKLLLRVLNFEKIKARKQAGESAYLELDFFMSIPYSINDFLSELCYVPVIPRKYFEIEVNSKKYFTEEDVREEDFAINLKNFSQSADGGYLLLKNLVFKEYLEKKVIQNLEISDEDRQKHFNKVLNELNTKINSFNTMPAGSGAFFVKSNNSKSEMILSRVAPIKPGKNKNVVDEIIFKNNPSLLYTQLLSRLSSGNSDIILNIPLTSRLVEDSGQYNTLVDSKGNLLFNQFSLPADYASFFSFVYSPVVINQTKDSSKNIYKFDNSSLRNFLRLCFNSEGFKYMMVESELESRPEEKANPFNRLNENLIPIFHPFGTALDEKNNPAVDPGENNILYTSPVPADIQRGSEIYTAIREGYYFDAAHLNLLTEYYKKHKNEFNRRLVSRNKNGKNELSLLIYYPVLSDNKLPEYIAPYYINNLRTVFTNLKDNKLLPADTTIRITAPGVVPLYDDINVYMNDLEKRQHEFDIALFMWDFRLDIMTILKPWLQDKTSYNNFLKNYKQLLLTDNPVREKLRRTAGYCYDNELMLWLYGLPRYAVYRANIFTEPVKTGFDLIKFIKAGN